MADNNVGNAQGATVEKTIHVGLVRNGYGQPQFEDFSNIPKEFHHLLTEEDWQYIKEQQELQNGDYAFNPPPD